MTYNVQGAKPVFLVDETGNSYTAGGGAGGGALDASFQQVTANGALGALNANLAISIGRRATLTLHVTGTWTGTISLQGSLDGGTTWVTLNAAATWVRLDNGSYSATIGTNAIYQASVTGLTSLRVAMTAYTSGSANVFLVASDEPAGVAIDTSIPAGTNYMGRVRLTDGTTDVSMRGSTSVALATDASVVVQQSPNQYAQTATTILNLAATTNAGFSKAASGSVLAVDCFNGTAATAYLKLFNKASAPTLGTDIPVVVIPVAAGAYISFEYGALGKRLGTGIAYAVTLNAVDTDATALATAGGHVNISYI